MEGYLWVEVRAEGTGRVKPWGIGWSRNSKPGLDPEAAVRSFRQSVMGSGLQVEALPLATVWRRDWRRIGPPVRRLGWNKHLSGVGWIEAITYLLVVRHFFVLLFQVRIQKDFLFIRRSWLGNSLVVQWLGLHTVTAGAWVQGLVGELRSCKPHCRAKRKHPKVVAMSYSSKPILSRFLDDLSTFQWLAEHCPGEI